MDKRRLGVQTIRRRRRTARGTKPVGTCQHRCERFYLYGAIAPRHSAGSVLGLPTLNAAQFQVFLNACAHRSVHAAQNPRSGLQVTARTRHSRLLEVFWQL